MESVITFIKGAVILFLMAVVVFALFSILTCGINFVLTAFGLNEISIWVTLVAVGVIGIIKWILK